MRKRKLIFYDEDRDYAARFADFGNHREGALFEILPFTEKEELERFLEEQQADLALVPPEILSGRLEQQAEKMLLLTEEREYSGGTHPGI